MDTRPNDPAADFADRLNAALNCETTEEYQRRNELILANLDRLENPSTPADEAAYQRMYALKCAIGSLWCSAFNKDRPVADRLSALENAYAAQLVKYNRRFLVTGKAKLIARYLLWRKSFTAVESHVAFLVARELGVLRKTRYDETCPWSLVVVGLDRKEGDNVFTVDKHERHYRQYQRTIGRQAFVIDKAHGLEGAQLDAFLETVPELDPTFRTVAIRDGKYCSRASAFSRKAIHETYALLTSDMATCLRITPSILAVPAAAPTAEQLAFDLDRELAPGVAEMEYQAAA
jgi:hypothetical protein